MSSPIQIVMVDPVYILAYAWCIVTLGAAAVVAIGLMFCFPDRVD